MIPKLTRFYSWFHAKNGWAVTLVYVIIFVVSLTSIDPDFGWHLKAGEYTLANWLPTHDIFTYTASNFPWISHEWGSDVILATLYKFGGYLLLALFYAGIWTAALFINNRRLSVPVALIASMALMPYLGIRELAWSILGFAILLKLLESKQKHLAYIIPLLILAWTNLHGGFVIGIAVIGYYVIKRRTWEITFTFLASIIASFVNPYGPRIYEEIARTMFDSELHANISEWAMMSFSTGTSIFIALWVASFIITKPFKWRDLLSVKAILLYASVSATRNTPFFITYVANDIDKIYTYLVKDIPKKKIYLKTRVTKILLATLIPLSLIGVCYAYISDTPTKNNYPSTTLDYLNQSDCNTNIFVHYNFGGFIIWKAPNYKVYIDGRMPSWEDKSGTLYIDNFYKVLDDQKFRQSEFDKYDVNCVLLDIGDYSDLTDELLVEGWVIVARDDASQLFMRW